MEQFELIENYLSNNLTDIEKQDFENRLVTDKDFAENFTIYKTINSEMATNVANKETEFRSTLQPMQNAHFSNAVAQQKTIEVNNKSGKVRKMVFAALSAAALIAIVFTFVIPSSKTNNKGLYAEYAQHDAVNNTVRGGTQEALMKEASTSYNNKNYAAAIKPLEQLKDSSAQAAFMLGVSYMETNVFDHAVAVFDLLTYGHSIYKEKAEWYIALTYLKKEDIVKCKDQLKAIANASSYYAKAQELLKKL